MAKKSTSTKGSGSKGSIPPTTGTTIPLRPIKKDKKWVWRIRNINYFY